MKYANPYKKNSSSARGKKNEIFMLKIFFLLSFAFSAIFRAVQML